MIATAEYPHEPHWISRQAFSFVSFCFFATQAALAVAVHHDLLWLAVPLALVASHFMHGFLIGFHEASHGLLRTNRLINEIDGVVIGIFSFSSFSLYRAAHQTHHMHLATARDEELWPFTSTAVPRWQRCLFAGLELFAGLLFTPAVFLRTFLRKDSPIRSRKVRRRIWAELVLTAVVWIALFAVTAAFDAWRYLIWLFLVPAWLAANLQAWRKYIEHVGMTGSTVRGATRSIVPESWLGRFFAFTLLHEPFHGVHHQRAGLTHAELPACVADLQPAAPDERGPFPSYRHALRDLLKSLADPQVGAQWRPVDAAPRRAT